MAMGQTSCSALRHTCGAPMVSEPTWSRLMFPKSILVCVTAQNDLQKAPGNLQINPPAAQVAAMCC
jgi:hypothetical protein